MSQWCRLWDDMPNDPKWRVVARRAGRPVSEVLAVFIHMMTNTTKSRKRGSIEGWSDEDIAIAIDADPDHVEAIRGAMQGKTLDGEHLTGWEKRQPNNRPPGSVWAQIRNEIFTRDDFACQYCQRRAVRLECDHVVPVSRGGSHDSSNLVTACFDCNRSKGTRMLSDWDGKWRRS